MSRDIATSATGAVAREERCTILYARIADGVEPEQGYAIRDALNDADTSGWWFVNPGSFTVVFTGSKRAEQAAACRASLSALAHDHPSWPRISCGVADGVIFGAFTSAGILESMPMGSVVTAAMKDAIANAG